MMGADVAGSCQPSFEEVKELAKKGNVIPIFVEEIFDMVTPVSVYLKIAEGKKESFLLESVAGGEKLGRYSFVGAGPKKVIRCGPGEEHEGDPLNCVEKEMADVTYVPLPGLPFFTGGAVGYVSYDCVSYFEPRTKRPLKDVLGLPEAVFLMCRSVVVVDHLHHKLKIVSHVWFDKPSEGTAAVDEKVLRAAYDEAVQDITELLAKIKSPHIPMPEQGPVRLGLSSVSNLGKSGYEGIVTKLKENIRQGDIIQAVPSQRLARPTDVHPFNIYRHLRSINPSPYMFYVNLGEFQIVGASPETLVKVVDGVVETHPIAGTRKRGKTAEEDLALEKELLSDVKERAEHIMLVDLGRNDVNRICEPRSVKVESLMHIERYSHVMHIVSRVTGQLRSSLTPLDAFRSIFPAGTVSGAPKVRAIELVSEYEGEKRHVYAGAVGYFGFNGDLDTAIAIRTMVVKDGMAYLQAGGGIVFDSKEEDEFMETVNKLNSNVVTLRKAEEYYAAQVGIRHDDDKNGEEPPRKRARN